MAETSSANVDILIKDGDHIVFKKEKVLKIFRIQKDRFIWFERIKICVDDILGQKWGSVFDVINGKLKPVSREQLAEEYERDTCETKDNRELVDGDDNQKLTRENIINMKQEGASGQDIVENLIENSATFSKKTEFAQDKYIKKKKKKHLAMFTVLKPTLRLVAQMYYRRGPSKICGLRFDALGALLTYANVHANNRLMVVDSCLGLLLAAVMHRLGGTGQIVHFYGGTAPVRQALEAFDFPQEYHDTVQYYPLNQLAIIHNSEKQIESSSINSGQPTAQIDSDPTSQNNSGAITTQNTESNGDAPKESEVKKGADDGGCQEEEGEKDVQMKEVKQKGADDSVCQEEEGEKDVQMKEVKQKHIDCAAKTKRTKKSELTNIEEAEERDRRRQARLVSQAQTQTLLKQCSMDGLIVATKYHPTPIVLHLLDYMLPSRPIAIFCQYKEPLLDCYGQLRERGGVISLRLSETWLRNYQVLPNRSHPEINMNGCGGYLLTGITVDRK